MKNFAALAAFVLAVLSPCLAEARPVVIEESSRITNPDPATYPDMGPVAIDGDTIMVAADRIIQHDEGPSRNTGLFVYRNIGGTWRPTGRISTADVFTDNVFNYGLDMENGIAVLGAMPFQVFERRDGAWSRSDVDVGTRGTSPGRYVRVSNGRILLGGSYGTWSGDIWERDTAGVWRFSQYLAAEFRSADDEFEGGPVDLFGNLAAISSPYTDDGGIL